MHYPWVVWRFSWQTPQTALRTYSESDGADCRAMARSTSGGVILLGTHTLKFWSVTQKHVTLSSAEAELMAMVRCATECIGVAQLARSWAMDLEAHIYADSSAALAICQRQGCGRLRHVRIGHLWVQERVSARDLVLHKVPGEVNPADVLTKGLTPGKLQPLMQRMSQFYADAEATSRVQLHTLGPIVAALPPHLIVSGNRAEEGCLRDPFGCGGGCLAYRSVYAPTALRCC